MPWDFFRGKEGLTLKLDQLTKYCTWKIYLGKICWKFAPESSPTRPVNLVNSPKYKQCIQKIILQIRHFERKTSKILIKHSFIFVFTHNHHFQSQGKVHFWIYFLGRKSFGHEMKLGHLIDIVTYKSFSWLGGLVPEFRFFLIYQPTTNNKKRVIMSLYNEFVNSYSFERCTQWQSNKGNNI